MQNYPDIAKTLFVSRRPATQCIRCHSKVALSELIYCEDEKKKGLCFTCSPASTLVFLAPGNVALTRRSAKLSPLTIVQKEWNQRRRRYERRGQYITEQALKEAHISCAADAHTRAEKNRKAAIKREVQERMYLKAFALEIRRLYPYCPPQRELAIALHACEKHSGRVGRAALAKEFDPAMIERAVIAHIRHSETSYDEEFGKGLGKREIREVVRPKIKAILQRWKSA